MNEKTQSAPLFLLMLTGGRRLALEVCRIAILFRGVDKIGIWGEKTGYFSEQVARFLENL